MKVREKKWIRFRIYLVATVFLTGLGIILGRAYQLQVLEKDRLGAIARQGYIGTIKLPPKRGIIYDRKGDELAVSVEVGSVYAHPNRIKEKAKTARQLSRSLGERRSKIFGLLKKKRSFVWIKRKIPPNLARRIKKLDLVGVGVTAETRRYYPNKEIAAHLIGFVGSENQGLEGLEKHYDRLLKGPQNSLIQMRDALARPFSIRRPAFSGHGMHDLILTIDKDIQYQAEQALKSAVKKTKARAGQCLVMNPKTGEILAMAVVPEFNPNIFSKFKADQWRNRAITDCFEPGSTVKAFLLASGLEESVVAPTTKFDCENGEYRVGNHIVHDTHKYGVLSVSDIVVYSSNIGAVKIGKELGYSRFYKYLKKFGFGSKTGVDLLGERKGFVRLPDKARPFDRITPFFGQGMTVTSLQMATAMAAIANGGKLMRPYVVKSIVDESGNVMEKGRPKVVRRVISSKTARKLTRILEGVVRDKGTGVKAAIRGFCVAGKTGTAQKVDPVTKKYSNRKYVAVFFGFVPADQPRLVILVVIDEPKGVSYGGVVAAPVFRQVGLWTLNYLRINPNVQLVDKGMDEKEDGNEISGTDRVSQKHLKIELGFLPDFAGLGMREVIKKGRSLGLKVFLEGTGLAFKQDPGPGVPLKDVHKVRVCFRPPA
ncbi:MAG TPA: penicillin-binding protein [Desulfobacteraceae bacterium]|nr:penicillin-binding protein [Desulfobacteraceae bacterium]